MEPIEMAALGRPLYPGMLYDCRRDSFIPGVTLWDKASLTEDLDKHQQPHTDLKFSSSDSLSDKASLLDVSATLKASFLGGLVEVGGSAKYLRDQKSSARQSRVTLQFSQTTRFEQLMMTQLGRITYPQVFEEKTATHVITAVLYGAQAFMVFDKTASENEDKQEVDGKLDVMVKKMRLLSIEGEGALQMNDNEKKLAESISCTFYGDCEENPTTYMEALQLYRKLPSLLRQKEDDAVPVRVWLHPLARLDNRAAKLEREISATLVSRVESVLEDLGDVERTYNDLVKNKHVNNFQEVRERLKMFQESFSDYKVLFQKALRKLLPAVRGGKAKEEALANIPLIHSNSPFTKIKKWLENVQGELNLLNSYVCELSAFPIITSSAQFNSILFDPMVDTVVCFTFTSLKHEDPYLSAISEFVRVNEFEKLSAVPESPNPNTQAWFTNPTISRRMRENLFLFKSFAETNKEKTSFVISSISDSSNPGTSIYLYKKGELMNSKFQPVSKPPAPSVDVLDRSLVLKLQKSPTGETVQFRVEHRTTQPDDSGADAEVWEVTGTPDAQETFTLTGLQLVNQCWVRYRAVSDVGVSEASDSVCIPPQGKGIVPLGQSWNGTASSLCNGLRDKINTSLGSSWWGLSTNQSEVTNWMSSIGAPYSRPITGGLRAGLILFFQGEVPSDSNGFAINLKLGPNNYNDIALHFNPRFDQHSSVFNSFRGGHWESEERSHNPFIRGRVFDIFMSINPEGYEVIVNGNVLWHFRHRMPLEEVSTYVTDGDVFMNTFGISEVDSVNMKVTIPAHV